MGDPPPHWLGASTPSSRAHPGVGCSEQGWGQRGWLCQCWYPEPQPPPPPLCPRATNLSASLPLPEYCGATGRLNLATYLRGQQRQWWLRPRVCVAYGECPGLGWGLRWVPHIHDSAHSSPTPSQACGPRTGPLGPKTSQWRQPTPSVSWCTLQWHGRVRWDHGGGPPTQDPHPGPTLSTPLPIDVLLQADVDGMDTALKERLWDPSSRPGALWHIFRAEDASRIQDFLQKVGTITHPPGQPWCPSALLTPAPPQESEDQRQEGMTTVEPPSRYLDLSLRRRLHEECGVSGWTLLQFLGDAVLVPAGAPHQVGSSATPPPRGRLFGVQWCRPPPGETEARASL